MLNVDQESSWPSVNTCKEHQFVKNTQFPVRRGAFLLLLVSHLCCSMACIRLFST